MIEAVERHLVEHAPAYFPDLAGPLGVRRIERRDRDLSSLLHYEIEGADGRREVVVKALSPRLARATPPAVTRPGLGKWCEPGRRVRLEYETMAAIQRHFEALGDPRYSTIRVLDILPEHHAIVMGKATERTLRDALLGSRFLFARRPGADVACAVRRAGAWLRAYHAMPLVRHVLPHRTRRDEFVRSVHDFARYLGVDRYGAMAEAVESKALEILPEELPAGMGHGDFAPRNVLVEHDGRVIGFDTLGRWQVNFHQDLAHFLTALKLIGPRVLTQGLAFGHDLLKAYEHEFLTGYFGEDTPPLTQIRLFEIEAVLDRLAAAAHRYRLSGGAARWVERSVRSRFFRCHLDRLAMSIGVVPGRASRG